MSNPVTQDASDIRGYCRFMSWILKKKVELLPWLPARWPKNIIIKYPKSLEVFRIFDKCESFILKFCLSSLGKKRYCFPICNLNSPQKKKSIPVTFTTQKLRSESSSSFKQLPYRIHDSWYILPTVHLPWKSTLHVGKLYQSPWIPSWDSLSCYIPRIRKLNQRNHGRELGYILEVFALLHPEALVPGAEVKALGALGFFGLKKPWWFILP